jgi:hypothetical protein
MTDKISKETPIPADVQAAMKRGERQRYAMATKTETPRKGAKR